MTHRDKNPTIEQLLNFAAANPGRSNGNVEERIRQQLGITPSRYHQLLHRAMHTKQALEYDPVTTHRLIRQSQHLEQARIQRQKGQPLT